MGSYGRRETHFYGLESDWTTDRTKVGRLVRIRQYFVIRITLSGQGSRARRSKICTIPHLKKLRKCLNDDAIRKLQET